jgi:hypothetical protein
MQSTRPTSSGHRLSVSSGTSGSVGRLNSRAQHAHSLSVGSLNPHRVSRRKSSSNTALNNGAAMAAWRESSGTPRSAGKGSMSKVANGAFPSSLPSHASAFEAAGSDVVADGPPLASLPEAKASGKPRVRRASEGSRLSKGDSKRSTAPDLKCEKCGKGYKHSSCLSKHLWVSLCHRSFHVPRSTTSNGMCTNDAANTLVPQEIVIDTRAVGSTRLNGQLPPSC